MVPTYSHEEVNEAIESLLSTWVTMGKKVKAFEDLFSSYIGVQSATMVNSGSSANLLALAALTNPAIGKLQPGDEIITPAVTWATTVYPISNVGCVPHLVDVGIDTFTIDPDEIRKAINVKTRVIMLVHLLGRPCNMDEITEIAREHNLIVIEDTCEAHGASYKGAKVGSLGDLATFSFFFSHHISTIEGGMILTNNEEYADMVRGLRAFGWIRDLKDKDALSETHRHIDPRFLFVNTGFNVRPTEIQGAFGIHQMKKLEDFIAVRRENAHYWNERLQEFSDFFILPKEEESTRHVYFSYPLTVKEGAPFTCRQLVGFLESKLIETRPIMAGNIAEQPVMKRFPYRKGALTNSEYIMKNSFFWANHQRIGQQEREYIFECVHTFVKNEKA